MVRALFLLVLSVVCSVFLGGPLLIYAMLSGDTDPLYRAGLWSSRAVLWLSGVRLVVSGREKIPGSGPCVFMPNHQSNCDAPAALVSLPAVLIMAKKEFFRFPVLGRAMRLRGFIPVNRKSRREAIEAVEQAIRAIKAGNSFLVFPEGTRSPDGRLQPFKKGAFIMAMRAGAPIVPISISGSGKVMRKGEFAVHPGTVRITFHEPVLTEGRAPDGREQVMAQVRLEIASALTEEERPLPSS